jgi:flotillin
MIMVETFAVIAMVIMLIVIFLTMFIFAWRYKKVPPDKAMVVYGRSMGRRGPRYRDISGGGKFMMPVIEDYDFIPLDVRNVEIDLIDVRTAIGEKKGSVRFKATVLVKVTSEPSGLHVAVENLLGKKPDEIDELAKVILEGTIRHSFLFNDFDSLDSKWDVTAARIWNRAQGSLHNYGLEIMNLSIHAVDKRG